MLTSCGDERPKLKMTMRISRRTFASGLVGMAAAGGLPLLAPPARADTPTLEARAGSAQLVPDYPATPIWGYEGRVPGPVIRVRQGERVRRRFVNELPQASTVHWHGIRIDNAMDGVPELTQAAVPPGGSFLYDFVAPDAGTYWYKLPQPDLGAVGSRSLRSADRRGRRRRARGRSGRTPAHRRLAPSRRRRRSTSASAPWATAHTGGVSAIG